MNTERERAGVYIEPPPPGSSVYDMDRYSAGHLKRNVNPTIKSLIYNLSYLQSMLGNGGINLVVVPNTCLIVLRPILSDGTHT